MKDFKVKEPLYGETGWAFKNDKNEIILDNEFKLYKSGTKLVLNDDDYTINYIKTRLLNEPLSEKRVKELSKININSIEFHGWNVFAYFNKNKGAGSVVASLKFRDKEEEWYLWDPNKGAIMIGPEKEFKTVKNAKKAALDYIKKNATALIDENTGLIRLNWN